MNILFLPINIASMQAITAEALDAKEGINAVCLTMSVHKYQALNETTIVLPNKYVSRKNPIKWFSAQRIFKRELMKWIKWADILHYTWEPAYKDGRDLRWIKKMNKPIFIEWVGSDIRDSDFLAAINPYYKHAFDNGYECRPIENGEHKKMTEQNFHAVGAIPTLCAEMSMYLNKTLFSSFVPLMQRINVKAFLPQFPSRENNKPLIVHSPSAKITKGSNFIIAAIEELKKDFDFEFVLLHDMKREDVLNIIRKADIFLDQIIIGGYGMASMEAMAFGKPVMCHLLPQVFESGLPQECPIVNTNPDNLKEQLIKLLTDAQLRQRTGMMSRAYVEKYHDAEKISDQLLKVYTQALEKNKNDNAKTA
jgi:hypothetical protein